MKHLKSNSLTFAIASTTFMVLQLSWFVHVSVLSRKTQKVVGRFDEMFKFFSIHVKTL